MGKDQLQKLADLLEREIGPLLEVDHSEGGFDCCGCSTTREVLDTAKGVLLSMGGDV